MVTWTKHPKKVMFIFVSTIIQPNDDSSSDDYLLFNQYLAIISLSYNII